MNCRLLVLLTILVGVLAPHGVGLAKEKGDRIPRSAEEDKAVAKRHKEADKQFKEELAAHPELYDSDKAKEQLRNRYLLGLILFDECTKQGVIETVMLELTAEIEKQADKFDTEVKRLDHIIDQLATVLFVLHLKAHPAKGEKLESEELFTWAKGAYVADLWYRNLPRAELDKFNAEWRTYEKEMAELNKKVEQAAVQVRVEHARLRAESKRKAAEEEEALEAYLAKLRAKDRAEAMVREAEAKERKRLQEAQRKRAADALKRIEQEFDTKEELGVTAMTMLIQNEMKIRKMAGIGFVALKQLAKVAWKLIKKALVRVVTGGGLAGNVLDEFIDDEMPKLKWPSIPGLKPDDRDAIVKPIVKDQSRRWMGSN